MGKGTPQTTNQSSSVSIPPWLSSAYLQLAGQAQSAAAQPFQPYDLSQMVAGFTPEQAMASTNSQNMAAGNVPGLGGNSLGFATTNYGTAAQLPQVGAQVAMNALPYFQGAGDLIGQAPGYIAGAGGMIQQGQGYLSQGANYLNQGTGYLNSAMAGVGAANAQAAQATNALSLMPYNVDPYMSPYIQHVVDTTQGQFNNQNSIQGNSLIGQAIAAGNAFGGDRAGVAQAQLAGQQQTTQAPVIAGLYNQGYVNAQNEFNTQQAIDLQSQQLHNQNLLAAAGIGMQGAGIGVQGAGVMGQYGGIMGQLGGLQGQLGSQYGALGSQLANIGSAYGNIGSNVASTGGLLGQLGGQLGSIAGGQANIGLGLGNLAGNANNQLFNIGTAAQGTNQALATDAYNQFLAQQGYPFQTTGWLGNLLEGLGSHIGSTTTGTASTTPASNPLATAAGLGMGLFSLSDERAKENMKKVGESNSGQPIYKFNYKGSPTTQLGFSAQETEQRKPEAVTEDSSGLKYVDYDTATAKSGGGAVASSKQALMKAIAEARNHRQHMAMGGTPLANTPSYVNAPSYVPQVQQQTGGGLMTSNFQAPGLMNTQANSTAELNKIMKQLAPKVKDWFNSSSDSTPAASIGSSIADSGIDSVPAFAPGSQGDTNAGGFAGGGTSGDYSSSSDSSDQSYTPPPTGNIGYTALMNAMNRDLVANNIIAQMTRSYAEGGGIDAEESTDDSGGPDDNSVLPDTATAGRRLAQRPLLASPSGAAPAQGAAPQMGFNPFNLSDSTRQALLATAAGMLSAQTPHFGQALGAGVSQGLQQYKTAEALSLAAKREQRQIDHQNASLGETARHHRALESPRGGAAFAKPVLLGEDPYKGKIYGVPKPGGGFDVIDPASGRIGTPATPATTATTTAVATTPEGAPETTPAPTTTAGEPPPAEEAALPGKAKWVQGDLRSLVENATPEGVRPEVLQRPDVTPAEAARVKAIAEGRQQFPSVSRNNLANRKIIDLVNEYDPSADQTTYARRQKTTNAFMGGGTQGNRIASMNTLGQHVSILDRVAVSLDNGQWPSINAITNEGAKALGFKDRQNLLAEWETARKGVADEAAAVFAGGGPGSALADREHWFKLFDPADPLGRTQHKLGTLIHMVDGRLDSLAEQYNEGMRTSHKPADFIRPKTKEVFDRVRSYDSGDKPAEKTDTAAPTSPNAPVHVKSPEEAKKLLSGTKIILPDGRTGTVP